MLNNNIVDNDYNYYDYELSNNSLAIKFSHDAALLPNPELFDSTEFGENSNSMVDIIPNINNLIPDNSLADTDLHDHDFMDNIMYIYYGSHSKTGYTYGSEIILIGSVLSCAAQFLTIICILLRRKHHKTNTYIYKSQFNIVVCLCVANLIFMLGVYVSNIFKFYGGFIEDVIVC